LVEEALERLGRPKLGHEALSREGRDDFALPPVVYCAAERYVCCEYPSGYHVPLRIAAAPRFSVATNTLEFEEGIVDRLRGTVGTVVLRLKHGGAVGGYCILTTIGSRPSIGAGARIDVLYEEADQALEGLTRANCVPTEGHCVRRGLFASRSRRCGLRNDGALQLYCVREELHQ
jgi:hypothetical protein